MTELTDADLWGSAPSAELSDADLWGTPAAVPTPDMPYSAENPPHGPDAFVKERRTINGQDYYLHSETGEIYGPGDKVTVDPAILQAFGKTRPTKLAQRRYDAENPQPTIGDYAGEFGGATVRGAGGLVGTMATGAGALTSDIATEIVKTEEGIKNLRSMEPEAATEFVNGLSQRLSPAVAWNYDRAARLIWKGRDAEAQPFLEAARKYTDTTPVEDQALVKAGKSVADAAREAYPVTPGFEGSLTSQLGEAAGSTLPLLPLGLLGGPAVTLAGTAAGAGESYDTAKRDFATARRDDRAGLYNAGLGAEAERQARLAAQLGTMPGASEAVPIDIFFDMAARRIPGLRAVSPRFREAFKRVAAQTMAEGGQEGFQTFTQNVIQQMTTNPEQELSEDVLKSMALGGAVGGGMQTGMEVGAGAIDAGKAAVDAVKGPGQRPATPPNPSTRPPNPASQTRQEPRLFSDEELFGPKIEGEVASDPVEKIDTPPAPAVDPDTDVLLQSGWTAEQVEAMPPQERAQAAQDARTAGFSEAGTLAPDAPPPGATPRAPGFGTRSQRAVIQTPEDLAAVRPVVAAEPSDAQKAAGNYQKAHIRLHGFDISIENPAGSIRTGKDPDTGKDWQSPKLPADYGYIKGTEGKDGDHVDVYIGPKSESQKVFVVDQLDIKSGKFDEHKAVLGVDTLDEAVSLYTGSFDNPTLDRIGDVVEMDMADFQKWVANKRATKKPAAAAGVGTVLETPRADDRERIVSPAITVDGKIYTGTSHWEAVEAAARSLNRTPDDVFLMRTVDVDGFVTSNGRYVDRKTAADIAATADQIAEQPAGKLFSEQLGKHADDVEGLIGNALDEEFGQSNGPISQSNGPETPQNQASVEQSNGQSNNLTDSVRLSDLQPSGDELAQQHGQALDKFLAGKQPVTPENFAAAAGLDVKTAGIVLGQAGLKGRILQTRRGTWMRAPRRLKPINALAFIASIGGIQDVTGELRGMDAHKAMTEYGPVVRPRGQHPDEVLRTLVEAGYMNDPGRDAGGQLQLTVADLYEFIDRNLRGEKAYRPEDQAKAEEIKVTAQNADKPADWAPVHPIARRFSQETLEQIEAFYAESGTTEEEWSVQMVADAARFIFSDGMEAAEAFERAAIMQVEADLDLENEFPENIEWMRKAEESAKRAIAELPPFPADEVPDAAVQDPDEDRAGATQPRGDGREAGEQGAEGGPGEPIPSAGESSSEAAADRPRGPGETTAEIQAADSDELVPVTLTAEGPWDFNDTFPLPDVEQLRRMEAEGRHVFDGTDTGLWTVEEVVYTVQESLNEMGADQRASIEAFRQADDIEKGRAKPKKGMSAEKLREEGKRLAQSVVDAANQYDFFPPAAIKAMIREAKRDAKAQQPTRSAPKAPVDIAEYVKPDVDPAEKARIERVQEWAAFKAKYGDKIEREQIKDPKRPQAVNWAEIETLEVEPGEFTFGWTAHFPGSGGAHGPSLEGPRFPTKEAAQSAAAKRIIQSANRQEGKQAEAIKAWAQKYVRDEVAPKPTEEAGAEGKPQLVIPGAEKIPDKKLAEMQAAKPLKGSKPQKDMDVGMFGDAPNSPDLFDKPAPKKAEAVDIQKADDVESLISGAIDEEFTEAPADGVKALKQQLIRFASGLSRAKDFESVASIYADYPNRGAGIDIQEISQAGMETIAQRIVDWGVPTFVDSGAFGVFRKNMRDRKAYHDALADMFAAEGAKPPPIRSVDFPAVLKSYEELLEAIEKANPAEEQGRRPYFVAPDVVGDQAASLSLIDQNRVEIRALAPRVIIPLQTGKKTLAESYAEVRDILEVDFIAGIPSNEKAVTPAQFKAFLKAANPSGIHFLGAVSDERLENRLEAMAAHQAATGWKPEHVSADGNILRSALYGVSKVEGTRDQQISVAVKDNIVRTTPGTKVEWRDLKEWIDGAITIANRRVSRQMYDQQDAHWRALEEIGEAWVRSADETTLRSMHYMLHDSGNTAWAKPARGNRGGTQWEKLNQIVTDRLAQIERAAANPIPQGDNAKKAGEAAASAVKNTAMGLEQAAQGLKALFGDKNKLRSGPAFDEEDYARALPYFKAAVAHFKEAGADVAAMVKALVKYLRTEMGFDRETIENMTPYLARFVRDIRDGKESLDAPSAPDALEQDSGDATPGDPVGETNVPAAPGRDGAGPRAGGGRRGGKGGRRSGSGGRVSQVDAPIVGEGGYLEIPARQPEPDGGVDPDRERAGGLEDSDPRPPDAATSDEALVEAAQGPTDLESKIAAQKAASSIAHKPTDLENIRATLPVLTREQQEDVLKVEQRFDKPDGHGMLLTNGTGTGKTFSGLGTAMRFYRQGKKNILIVAPSQGILDSWRSADRRFFGMGLSVLESTTDKGQGVTATTYANLRANQLLADRDWDLVITDEAHNLSANKDGEASGALDTLRAITLHPDGLQDRARMVLRKEWAEVEKHKQGSPEMADAYRKFREKAEPLIEKWRAEGKRSKVLMLSATPFAYHYSLDYAQGYLYQLEEVDSARYNSGDARARFYISNFGYRMRYNKLTKPEPGVDLEIMERQFHERMKREGSIAGRALEVEKDYDRRFVLINSLAGKQIDEAMDFLLEADDRKFFPVYDIIRKSFDYLTKMRLLEAIKAREAVPYIRKQLALGRKVVVFHDYNEGGGSNPFDVSIPDDLEATAYADGKPVKIKVKPLYEEFLRRNPYVDKLKFSDYRAPMYELTAAFPKEAVIYNGTVSTKQRNANRDAFNTDGNDTKIIVIQAAAGEAGISLHDTTGKHGRVLLNLGMPVRPVTALQEEGRIYRVGQASDAMFRYFNTGTTWEREAFASRIAINSSTAENLAMGDQARAIRQSFIDAFEETDSYEPSPDEGKGGKERDRNTIATTSDFDKAKTHYFANARNTRRRDQREGVDYFATPEPLGLKMVEWANVKPGEKILEPSAGHGAIARYFPEETNRTLIEPSRDLSSRAALQAPGARVITSRFEDHDIVNKFDAIVMNPPFGSGGKTALEHVDKAFKHLKNGGRVVALIPRGGMAEKRFEKWYEDTKGAYLVGHVILPTVTFERAGTAVAAQVLILEKQTDKDVRPQEQRKRELENAETINELFDRIENIDMGERTEPKTKDTESVTEGDVTVDGIRFYVRERPESQAYFADLKEYIGPRFGPVKDAAEANGGRYNRPTKTFIFESREARQAFLDAVANPPAPQVSIGAEPPPGATNPRFHLAEFDHTKTGARQYVAQLASREGDDEYSRVNAIAKKHGGRYSSFRGMGAVPGFLFTSAEARARFMAEAYPQGMADRQAAAGFRVPAEQAARATAAIVDIVNRIMGPNSDLVRLWTATDPGIWNRYFAGNDALLDGQRRLISIALFGSQDSKTLIRHELIHFMRQLGMFTGQEWAVLRRVAQQRWIAQYDIRARYGDLAQQYPHLSNLEIEQLLEEEAIAAAFAEHANDKAQRQSQGVLARIFNKVIEIIEALGNAWRGNGFTSVEQVLETIERGDVGRRPEGSGQDRGFAVDEAAARRLSPPRNPPAGSFDAPHDEKVRQALKDSTDTLLNRIRRAGRAAAVEFRRKVQDREVDLKRTQDAITAAGGPIPEHMDTYAAATLYPGRTAKRDENLVRDTIEPLVEEIARSGLTLDEVDDYVMAIFARERNAAIAAMYPPGSQFAQAMTDPTIVGGSGLSEQQIRDTLDAFNSAGKTPALRRIGAKIVALNKRTLTSLRDEGLVEPDVYDDLVAKYPHYVPLRGFDDVVDNVHPDSPRTGSRYDVRGKEFQEAFGRTTKADSPLAYSIMQARQAIIRIEKNRVAKRMLLLAQNNPNRAFWEVNRVELKPVKDKTTGLVRRVYDRAANQAENVYAAKVGGKVFHIALHHDGLLRAMKGIGGENMHGAFVFFHKVNRYFAAMNTSYDPEFIFRNFIRDLQQAAIVLQEEQVNGIVPYVLTHLHKAAYGMNAMLNGNLSTPWARYAEEYAMAGGKVGFLDRNDIEDEKRSLEALMEQASAGPARRALQLAWEHTKGRLERYNDAVENTIRLATYVALRRQGVSKEKAAQVARDLTVNFNRKGEWSPYINSLYMFFNASMQGAANMAARLHRSKKMKAIAGGIIVFAFVQDMLNRWIAGDDDDEENRYDKIDDEIKARNFIIMYPKWFEDQTGVPYWKHPLPLGYNMFHILGTQAGHMVTGARNPLEGAGNIVAGIVDAFNPLGGGNPWNVVAPTVVDPFADIWANKDYFGEDIVPKTFDETDPDSSRYRESVWPPARVAAEGMNELTGGSDERPGLIDVSPESLEHLWEFAWGGVGRLVSRTWSTIDDVASDEPMDASKVPFARTFVGTDSRYADRDKYFEIRKQVHITKDEIKAREDDQNAAEIARIRSKHGREVSMIPTMERAEKDIRAINREIRKIKNNPGMGETTKRARIQEQYKKREAIELAVRRQWNSTGD